MAKTMKGIALLSVLLTAIFAVLYMGTESGGALTLAITFGTISYHFVMRLFVGFAVNLVLHNHVDYEKKWFRVSAAEERLYQKLKVKQWKGKLGTYDPDCFDSRIHTWEEIAGAMCQAELVHEVIIVLSFLPVTAAVPFGALPVFVITSLLAACVDAAFVMIQRYNRPRVVRLVKLSKGKRGKKQ